MDRDAMIKCARKKYLHYGTEFVSLSVRKEKVL